MELRDLDRIRFVTRHFNALRGLAFNLPVGLFFLAIGFVLLHAPAPRTFALSVVAILACCFLLAHRAAEAWYRTRFGEVEQVGLGEVEVRWEFLWGFGRAVLRDIVGPTYFRAKFGKADAPSTSSKSWPPGFTLLTAAFVIVDNVIRDHYGLRAETAFLYAAVATGLFRRWALLGRSRLTAHYLVLGTLLLVLAAAGWSSVLFVPALGFGPGAASGWMLIGCLFVLMGLLDHRLLVRTLAPLPPQEQETAPKSARQRG